MSASAKPRIALWFRYGPAEHTELFHAIPDIVEALAERCEVHYFGWRSRKPVPDRILRNAVVHHLPFTVNRQSGIDKWIKTALWLLALPVIGLRCRALNIRAVYIDETIPLSALPARWFFGGPVAMTVADFFVDVYLKNHPLLAGVARLIRAIDLATWRKLPLIFTRVRFTAQYLAKQGCRLERIVPVYDPCDFSVYHPIDKASARQALGYSPGDFVLVHHGILHPNKGNDRILRALADLRPAYPAVKYLLIGDGPDMPRLRKLVEELKLTDTVRFTGWIEKLEDVNTALNAGDVGLVMRVGEESDNFHVTGALVHSMACGLPILAARLGGVSEIVVDRQNGLLFDPGNMDEFKAALIDYLRHPEQCRSFGDAALASAQAHFDMQRVTRQTVEPLLGLIQPKEYV